MQEHSRYAVGIDVGTTNVRCAVAQVDPTTGGLKIVGVGTAPSTGMRKGVVVNVNGPAQAIDTALGEAERMSGHEISGATVSINGAHIMSTKSDGMIAAGSNHDHTITVEDVRRLEDVATIGKIPANREILEVVPHSYRLDGQGGIKDPVGMTGSRLEVEAVVVSALDPAINGLQGALEAAKVGLKTFVQPAIAAARAVLSEQQMEYGVALVDIGGATTNISIYEEGDLQYSGVVPLGGINITNDLAIGLKVSPEVAEKVKLEHASGVHRHKNAGISVKHKADLYNFKTDEIDEIVEARLEEIFEAVQAHFRKAGRARKLPSGVVLTGGTALLKGIEEYAKEALDLAAIVGRTTGYGGVVDSLEKPQFATVIGLTMIDSEIEGGPAKSSRKSSDGSASLTKTISGFFNRFKT